MRKSTILAALLALPFAPQASAQDWTAVPHELVMTAPANQYVTDGAILWRLVHATILPGEEFTDIRIRFIASSSWLIEPCRDKAAPCRPNVLGRLDFRLRNQPTGAFDDATAEISIGGAASIDRPSFDLAYMAELVELFTAPGLTIAAKDGVWSISSSNGFRRSEWQPMPLQDATHAVAFAANFRLPLTQIGDCVIRQIIAAKDDQSPEARALRANIEEIATHWLMEPPTQTLTAESMKITVDNQIRLRRAALDLLTREEIIPQTATDALKIDRFAELTQKYGEEFLTRDYEQLRLAVEYEKRVLAAKQEHGGLTAAYICENLVAP